MLFIGLMWPGSALAQTEMPPYPETPQEVVSYKPDYIPPSQIIDFLGVHTKGSLGLMRWQVSEKAHMVEIRHNDAANVIIISGSGPDVDHVMSLIREADIAPRQIEIEVKIIEVNTAKAQDIGLDWDQVVKKSGARVSYRYSEDNNDLDRTTYSDTELNNYGTHEDRISRDADFTMNMYLTDVLQLLDQSGAGTIRTAPRIVTLNNRRATILDGQRVTYVTRYASYTNLFETDSMDAGLTVSVLPSIGESGYITLSINAEMTSLGGEISGSPIKDGQLIENTVIVKDGESILLGGLTRTMEYKQTKRFPVLGYVLPFIFSRETKAYEDIESYMILTPRIIDFSTELDDRVKALQQGIEGETGK
jgi:type II secretory pathway component GspD/PulD (secretin)